MHLLNKATVETLKNNLNEYYNQLKEINKTELEKFKNDETIKPYINEETVELAIELFFKNANLNLNETETKTTESLDNIIKNIYVKTSNCYDAITPLDNYKLLGSLYSYENTDVSPGKAYQRKGLFSSDLIYYEDIQEISDLMTSNVYYFNHETKLLIRNLKLHELFFLMSPTFANWFFNKVKNTNPIDYSGKWFISNAPIIQNDTIYPFNYVPFASSRIERELHTLYKTNSSNLECPQIAINVTSPLFDFILFDYSVFKTINWDEQAYPTIRASAEAYPEVDILQVALFFAQNVYKDPKDTDVARGYSLSLYFAYFIYSIHSIKALTFHLEALINKYNHEALKTHYELFSIIYSHYGEKHHKIIRNDA